MSDTQQDQQKYDYPELPVLSKEQVRNKIKHVSASQINLIKGCPAKWSYKYLYDVHEYESTSQILQIGKFFHSLAENAAVMGKDQVFIEKNIFDEMCNKVSPTENQGTEGVSQIR